MNKGSIRDWFVKSSEQLLDADLLQVRRQQVLSPDTGDEQQVLTVDMSDWLTVVPLTSEGELVMVRQFRHGNRRLELELPGGLLDSSGESPASGAQRELLEETGYGGGHLISLGELWPQPAFLTNRIWFFAMTGVEWLSDQKLDAGEAIDVVLINPADIPKYIERGEIGNAMTVSALALAQKHTGYAII